VDPYSYSVIRFVALNASHDHGEAGLSVEDKHALVKHLAEKGPVFITSESPLPKSLQPYALPVESHRLHDVMAFARLVTGDGLSTVAEAALLGTPGVWASTYGAKLKYLNQLDVQFGLTKGSATPTRDELFTMVDRAAMMDTYQRQIRKNHLLAETVDLVAWYTDLIEAILDGRNPATPC
jgi:predicted glycosyltransferase